MINIQLTEKAFAPGELIEGKLVWQDLNIGEQLCLRLIWYTSGKGDQDFAIVHEQRIDRPGAQGEREFEFPAPAWPYSFSGKLITLSWAIEVVRKPGDLAIRADLVIGPQRQELSLLSQAEPVNR